MDAFGFLFIEPLPERNLPAMGHVYVKPRPAPHRRSHTDIRVLTEGSTNWSEFERELDRLQRELDDIRREAQLRFADSSAKKYVMGFQPPRLLRDRR